jgi:hypothetical protein
LLASARDAESVLRPPITLFAPPSFSTPASTLAMADASARRRILSTTDVNESARSAAAPIVAPAAAHQKLFDFRLPRLATPNEYQPNDGTCVLTFGSGAAGQRTCEDEGDARDCRPSARVCRYMHALERCENDHAHHLTALHAWRLTLSSLGAASLVRAVGHRNKNDVLRPTVVDSLLGKRVRSIAAGATSVAVVTEQGHVYMFGSGVLGWGERMSESKTYVALATVGRSHEESALATAECVRGRALLLSIASRVRSYCTLGVSLAQSLPPYFATEDSSVHGAHAHAARVRSLQCAVPLTRIALYHDADTLLAPDSPSLALFR